VFLSHTSEFAAYPRPRSYVQAAKDACNRNNFLPEDMSIWSAAGAPPAEQCRERVRDCDIYVGIIGFSYGSPVRDEPGHSYTELEFAEARNCGLHVLIFLLDEEEGEMPPGPSRGNPKHTARQEEFRQRLLTDRLTVARFRNPDHLGDLLGYSLRELPDTPRTAPVKQDRAAPFTARQVPRDAVQRPELAEICERILAAAKRSKKRSADIGSLTTALVGPPGFGKSILADWACHKLRKKFPDGVLRVELGEDPSEQQLIEWCKDLILAFDQSCPAFQTADEAGRHLGHVLDRRGVLLVLDDVWDRSDLEPFLHGGSSTVRLITTRDRGVLPPGANMIAVDQLSVTATQQILERNLDAEGVAWFDLARRTGGWALLANLVNGALRDEVQAGRDVADAVAELSEELAASGPALLDPTDRDQRRQAIGTTIEVSITRLRRGHGERAADRYQDLAIFPEDVDVPLELLAAWWRLPLPEVRKLAQTLSRLSLIQAYDAGAATVRLHDVLRWYLQSRLGEPELQSRHDGFVEAHRPDTRRWADLADDAKYLWRWAALHLRDAGCREELADTVRDVAYLAKKVHLIGTSAVLDDLELAYDDQAEERSKWFRRWSNLLEGLPRPSDVAATLRARPDAAAFLGTAEPQFAAPMVRYASGWSCPESAGTALDVVLGTHRERVQGCAWSPDGRRLASVDGRGFVQVLDVGGHAAPLEIGGDEWNVAVAWSPEGDRLACGDDEGVVRVWAVDSAAHPMELGRHRDNVRVVAWSPDGQRIASGGDDGVRVWNPTGGSELPILIRNAWIRAIAWSPVGGHRLACAYDDGVVLTWAVDTPDRTVELGRHDGEAFAVSWSTDGECVGSGGSDGAVRLWPVDSDDPPVAMNCGGSAVRALAWSADRRELAIGTSDGLLRTWTADDTVGPVDVGRHGGEVLVVAWPPDGTGLASGGGDGALRVWRVGSGAPDLNLSPTEDPVLSVAWSVDGRRLAGGTRSGFVRIWNARSQGERMQSQYHGDAVHAVAWSPDGRHLASGGDDGRVRVCDAGSDAAVLERQTAGKSVRALAWSPIRPRLACVSGDGTVQVWRLHKDFPTDLRRGQWVRALAWAPDGLSFATGDDHGRLQRWDVEAEHEPEELGRRADHGIRAIAWSAAGRGLVTGHNDGTIWLWDTDRKHDPVNLGRHRDEVHDVSWSPDGSQVASVGGDSVLHVWAAGADDRHKREPRCTLALAGSLSSVAWHPTNGRLAVADSRGLHVLEVVG
jgi:WD40 repeat protein